MRGCQRDVVAGVRRSAEQVDDDVVEDVDQRAGLGIGDGAARFAFGLGVDVELGRAGLHLDIRALQAAGDVNARQRTVVGGADLHLGSRRASAGAQADGIGIRARVDLDQAARNDVQDLVGLEVGPR